MSVMQAVAPLLVMCDEPGSKPPRKVLPKAFVLLAEFFFGVKATEVDGDICVSIKGRVLSG